jgi:hypothetical protein
MELNTITIKRVFVTLRMTWLMQSLASWLDFKQAQFFFNPKRSKVLCGPASFLSLGRMGTCSVGQAIGA